MAEGALSRVDGMLGWLRRYAASRHLAGPAVLADLGGAGFLGLQAAEADGGCALSHMELVRILQQLGAIDLGLGWTVAAHNCLGLRPLLQFGPRALQQTLLPAICGSGQAAAYALAEPGAGSHFAAMRTRARRVQGGWRLRGLKHPVALASCSSVMTVVARAWDSDVALGAIALLVRASSDGIVHERAVDTLGLRGVVHNAVGFDEVFVPDDHVLLAPGEGMRVAQDASAFARLGIGALCVGAVKRCAQLMVQAAGKRDIVTGRLLDNPVTRARLHAVTCAAWSLEALVDAIAAALDERCALPQHACAALKCLGTELLWEAADHLLQLCGADGYVDAAPAARMQRDARGLRLVEGSTESLWMELGAAAAPDRGAEHYIGHGLSGHGLGRSGLAAELGAAISVIRARAGEVRAFSGEAASVQWLDYRVGELCAWAVLLGAAELRAGREQGADALAAVDWARQRFDARRRAIEAEQAEAGTYPPPALLQHRIAAFAEAIGPTGEPDREP